MRPLTQEITHVQATTYKAAGGPIDMTAVPTLHQRPKTRALTARDLATMLVAVSQNPRQLRLALREVNRGGLRTLQFPQTIQLRHKLGR